MTDLHVEPRQAEETTGASRYRLLAAVAIVGLLFSVAADAGLSTFAGALLVAATASTLLGTGVMPNRRAWPLAAAAPLFGVWLGVRVSPWLVLLDLAAVAGLLLLAAALARNGDPFDLTLPGLVRRGSTSAVHVVAGPAHLVSLVPADAQSRRGAAAVARGVLIAAPIGGVVGVLLASADPVFGSLFDWMGDPGGWFRDLVLVALGAAGASGLAGAAKSRHRDWLGEAPRGLLGGTEALVVLAVLTALHAAFSVSQLVVIAGGARHVIETQGLTYAEYARSGFFQLLAVAVLTLAVLLGVRAFARTDDATTARYLLVLQEAAVGLTLVIVLVAVRRLRLYEAAFGLTMLRLYSTVFAVWIGAAFLLLGVALAKPLTRAWFIPAAASAGLALLLGLNIANPEAIVVRRNVARTAATETFDPWYLTRLSDDAVPALVESLPSLSPGDRAVLADSLCRRPRSERGLWSLNASRRAAGRALERLCGPAPNSVR